MTPKKLQIVKNQFDPSDAKPDEKKHASDGCFSALLEAILRGEFLPESTLPAERILAERFSVSRITLRAATHRLAALNILRVRQGGHTTVLDPALATDPIVTEFSCKIGVFSNSDRRDLAEAYGLHCHSLLVVAERRGTNAHWDKLDLLVEQEQLAGSAEARRNAELELFSLLAAASQNRRLIAQHAIWSRLVLASSTPLLELALARDTRKVLYKELAKRLRQGKNAAQAFLELLHPNR